MWPRKKSRNRDLARTTPLSRNAEIATEIIRLVDHHQYAMASIRASVSTLGKVMHAARRKDETFGKAALRALQKVIPPQGGELIALRGRWNDVASTVHWPADPGHLFASLAGNTEQDIISSSTCQHPCRRLRSFYLPFQNNCNE